MKNYIKKITALCLSVLSLIPLVTSQRLTTAHAVDADNDQIVVVSLGDSYSSGEGIPPFYGQLDSSGKDLPVSLKVQSYDWLAHRSTKSWPSLIEIPDIDGTMSQYRADYLPDTPVSRNAKCKWYFVASSGAETKHFNKEKQKKEYSKGIGKSKVADETDLPKQLEVFNGIGENVDYVTLSVGGNDVGFTDIIITCATGSTYLHHIGQAVKIGTSRTKVAAVPTKLQQKMNDLWDNIEATKKDIKKVYEDIHSVAPNAEIIVAGYPKLLENSGKGFLISEEEAYIVNENVHEFNKVLANIVKECQNEGISIHFVNVEDEFDKDGGHQAYSDNAWLNPIILIPQSEDLKSVDVGSAYSMHPNEEGAKAYARCVNAKIKEIENSKRKGTLSGKICKASDRNTAISGATINVYKDNNLYLTETSDADGNYSIELPIGRYYIKITADGYIGFNSYATVVYNTNTYMETFLMIEGSEDEKGIAKGKIVNSLTGSGTDGVKLSVVKDWNNTGESSEVVATVSTDSNGYYSLELPLGNYTVIASKEGYLSTSFNIIVQIGTTDNQNGTITPKVSGDEYLITLIWGENPRDLDSHVEGTLSNDNSFHVYYKHMNQNDGNVAVCNLDYDDRYSYGPEHITLKTTTDKPYYYYVYRYAGTGTVANSGAKVTVHKGNELIGTYNVPTNLGNGDYWNVFAIIDGELIVKNTITDKPETGYGTQQNGFKTVYSIPNDKIESTKNLNMVEWHPLEGLTSTMMELSTDETNIDISPDGTWTKSGNLLSKPMEIVNQSGTVLDAAGFVMNWVSNSQQITQLKVTTGKDKTIQIDYGSSFELGHSGKKTTLGQLVIDKYYNYSPSIIFSANDKADELIRNWFGLTGDGKYSMELKFGKVYIGDFGYRLVVENNELYQVPIVHKDSSYKVYYKEKGKDAVFVLDAANILRCTRIKLSEDEKKKVLDKLSENGFDINIK